MTDRYALEQVGVADGTLNPAARSNGGLVNAKRRCIRASLPGIALAAADRLYLGKLPQGAVVTNITVVVDTTLSTSTLSIGTTGTPAKYASLVTNTVVDKAVSIGPKGSAFAAAPLTAEEDIWLTVGTTTIGAGVVGGFDIEFIVPA